MVVRFDRERVRDANPLEDVIVELTGESLHASTAGEPRFRCAFHGDGVDAHPSGRVSIAKQRWYCDVCATGGDVFSFAMRHYGCTFSEALATLADRAGTKRIQR